MTVCDSVVRWRPLFGEEALGPVFHHPATACVMTRRRMMRMLDPHNGAVPVSGLQGVVAGHEVVAETVAAGGGLQLGWAVTSVGPGRGRLAAMVQMLGLQDGGPQVLRSS